MENCNENNPHMNICSTYDHETLMAFIDNRLQADRHEAVEKHLSSCLSCRNVAVIYRKIDYMFECTINNHLNHPDFIVAKSTVMERITGDNRKRYGRKIFHNLCNALNNILCIRTWPEILVIRKQYINIGCLVVTVLCLFFCFHEYRTFSTHDVDKMNVSSGDIASEKKHIEPVVRTGFVSLPQDTQNAVITSVGGEVSSLMIIESQDKKMTIIWYKEV